MLKTTKNYELLQPTSDEFYDVEIQNDNMDQVDRVLKELENSKAAQTDVNASVESLKKEIEAKVDKANPVFTGEVILPEQSADPSDNEAATVKFVRENGGGAAVGVSITDETQEVTEATEKNVESAFGSVGTRLRTMETAAPYPTESGTILYSTEEGVRRNIPFLIGEPKPISNFAVERFSTLDSLNVGDKVKFGSYNGVPITWRIVDKNHEGYPAGAVTLITDKIISLKCFDAIEPGNSDSERRTYGNNRYIYSNIRQWLNSDAAAGEWYSAQHDTDAPPTNANVYNGWNGYDKEAGFLVEFSMDVQRILLPTTLTVGRASADGGGSETCVDKIFLASSTEIGFANENNIAEGSKLAMFSDNISRQAYPTIESIINNEYTGDDLSASQCYWWRLRTHCTPNAYHARAVKADGTPDYYIACNSCGGIRPLCNVSEETMVKMDSDGTYTILESDGLNLSWTNPTDLLIPQTVHIRRSSEAYPATLEEGVEVYSGSDESCLDESAELSTDQYYTAWVDNSMVQKTDELMKVKYSHGVDYLMLYDHGDECVDVTGGWGESSWYDRVNDGAFTKNESSITQKTGNSAYDAFGTNQKIDLTGYDKMLFNMDVNNAGNTHSFCTDFRTDSRIFVNNKNLKNFLEVQKGTGAWSKTNYIVDVPAEENYVLLGIAGTNSSITLHMCVLLRTDNYTPWLRAGNLNPSDYPTLDSLLADETAMGVLMNSSVAVDRMIQYTGTVMAGVINSETAMTALGLSPYVNRVMRNPDWGKFLAMSPYLSIWDEQSNTVKVPVMTSNITPSGTTDASSYQNQNAEPWKTFDGDNSSGWCTDVGVSLPQWVNYDFGRKVLLYKLSIVLGDLGTDQYAKDTIGYFKIDGIIVGNFKAPKGQRIDVILPAPVLGKSVKIVITAYNHAYSSGQIYLRELQFYGKRGETND